jgi:hypothetical protein
VEGGVRGTAGSSQILWTRGWDGLDEQGYSPKFFCYFPKTT